MVEQSNGVDAGRVTCPNCGADFSAEDARCPYCGKLNPSGAEKEYMRTLDGIRDDTDDLADDAEENFEASLQRNTKRTIIIVVALVAALVALLVLQNVIGKHEERQSLEAYQAREAFRAQYFEEFDRLYEAGDDDALSEYVWNLMDDPGFEALYSWKHADYLQAHDDWEALRATTNHMQTESCSIDDYTWSVSVALRLAQLDASDSSPYATLSAEEEGRAAAYRAYAWEFLRTTLQMNDSEIASFAEGTKDAYGYIQKEKLKQDLEARLKQLGVSL